MDIIANLVKNSNSKAWIYRKISMDNTVFLAFEKKVCYNIQ